MEAYFFDFTLGDVVVLEATFVVIPASVYSKVAGHGVKAFYGVGVAYEVAMVIAVVGHKNISGFFCLTSEKIKCCSRLKSIVGFLCSFTNSQASSFTTE